MLAEGEVSQGKQIVAVEVLAREVAPSKEPGKPANRPVM
jgi:hypothetical protein